MGNSKGSRQNNRWLTLGFAVFSLVAIILVFSFALSLTNVGAKYPAISSAQFSRDLQEGKITKIVRREDSDILTLYYGDPKNSRQIKTVVINDSIRLPREGLPDLVVEKTLWPPWKDFLIGLLPMLMLIGSVLVVMRLLARDL